MHVLHIEDEDYAAYIVKEKLAKSIEVSRAASLHEAGLLLKVFKFDVLLVDLNLADSKGLNTLKILVPYRIPIIVLSAISDDDVVSHAARLGVEDYIRKEELHKIDLVQRLAEACVPRRLISIADINPLKRYISCPNCAILAS